MKLDASTDTENCEQINPQISSLLEENKRLETQVKNLKLKNKVLALRLAKERKANKNLEFEFNKKVKEEVHKVLGKFFLMPKLIIY